MCICFLKITLKEQNVFCGCIWFGYVSEHGVVIDTYMNSVMNNIEDDYKHDVHWLQTSLMS